MFICTALKSAGKRMAGLVCWLCTPFSTQHEQWRVLILYGMWRPLFQLLPACWRLSVSWKAAGLYSYFGNLHTESSEDH